MKKFFIKLTILFAGIFNTDNRVGTKTHFTVPAIFLIAKAPFSAVGFRLFKIQVSAVADCFAYGKSSYFFNAQFHSFLQPTTQPMTGFAIVRLTVKPDDMETTLKPNSSGRNCWLLTEIDTGKWRRGWDSNPRWARTHAGFQDRCIQPLCHLSVALVLMENRGVCQYD